MKPKITRIVVANSAMARFFESGSIGTGLVELKNLEMIAETREPVDQKPGRSFSRIGKHRSALQPHHHCSDAFAKVLTKQLEDSLENNEFDRLIIVASPDFLGAFRKKISQPVRSVLIADIPKNMTAAENCKISSEIEKFLAI